MRPNKLLGQNFLTSKKVARKIIETADIKSGDVVLEVGPGQGFLTEELLKTDGKIIAVEKDARFFLLLQEKFKKEIADGKLELIEGDILEMQNVKVKMQNDNLKLKIQDKKFKLVANIPYYLTSHLIRMFLELDCQPSKMVLMVQKEVADRILGTQGKNLRSSASGSKEAKLHSINSCGDTNDVQISNVKNEGKNKTKNDKESLLSVSVKAYGEPKIAMMVPAGCFSPMPKVDSAVLVIDNISKDFFLKNNIGEKDFFELVKKGFGSKRKMLKNNIKIGADILQKCGIDEKARAETLSLSSWACLVSSFK